MQSSETKLCKDHQNKEKLWLRKSRRSHRSIQKTESAHAVPKQDSAEGCTLQHLAYEKQLEYKFNKVKNCLERIGGLEKY